MDLEDDLTSEELALLASLQAKKAKQNWNARETERLAKLKIYEPLKDLLSVRHVTAQIEAIAAVMPNVDRETYQRLERLVSIMRYDAMPVAQQIELLSTPIPLPETATV